MGKFGSTVAQKGKKAKSPIRGLMPIMGLSLALLFAVTAFFLAPAIVDWARDQDGKIGETVADMEKGIPSNWPTDTLAYVVAVVLWLVMFSVSMTVVAAMVGEDPDKVVLKDMPVSPANRKALIKQMKKDLKKAKRRESEQKNKRQ